jgi:predicted ArsR family transcriptional regulator
MKESSESRSEVDRFILEQIDSVPHLEALLLVWNSRPKLWSADEVAKRLYIKPEVARTVLQDLARQQILVAAAEPPEQYRYESETEDKNRLLEAVNKTYREELVRVSTMIHSKASPAVREFARAFRFTKDRE